MATLNGTIEGFTYYNKDTGYSVIRLKGGDVAVGAIPPLKEGDSVRFEGDWTEHQKFGRQFKFSRFSINDPETSAAIKDYLSSGLIKGIGESTAEKIVSKFKEETIQILDNDPMRLTEIAGISRKKAESIRDSWVEQRSLKDTVIFLQSLGLSSGTAIKIYRHYGDRAKALISNNPYQMTFDIWGIGFKTADTIGQALGIENDSPLRKKAAIIYALEYAQNEGNTYLPIEELQAFVANLIAADPTEELPETSELYREGRLMIEEGRCYLPYLYYSERRIEEKIRELISSPSKNETGKAGFLEETVGRFSMEQIFAIRTSISSRVMILTGNPGTGKTTCLKGIIELHKKLKIPVMLAAPTGRAAKRMTEVIGIEARTIHRLLEYNPADKCFNRNRNNLLPAGLLVLDEVSMVDTALMASLLEALDLDTRLILVGDSDQLPSVGAGNVLRDLTDSGLIPVCALTQIFRQAEKSRIILAAHGIREGKTPEITNLRDDDLFFIEEESDAVIPEIVSDLISRRLPETYGFKPSGDIQVITPMYRGPCGADNLNRILQAELNSEGRIAIKKETNFKIGDRLMQLKNNYDKEVYNGDQGILESFNDKTGKFSINFQGRPVQYDLTETDELTLSYAITVHKSQGSEYPCVVMPLVTSHYVMLQRNLLYTAITRAKSLMVLIGSRRALNIAVHKDRVQKRYSSLFKA